MWSILTRSRGIRVSQQEVGIQQTSSITRQVVLEVLAQTSRGTVSRSTWLGLLASWLGTSATYLWAINRRRGDLVVRHTSRAHHALSPDYTPQPDHLHIGRWLELAPGTSAPWCDHASDQASVACQCDTLDTHRLQVVAMGSDGPLDWFIGFQSHNNTQQDAAITQQLNSLLPCMQAELAAYRALRRERLSDWIRESGHANLNHPSALALVLRGRQLECLHAPDAVGRLLQEHDSIAALEDHHLVCRSPVHQARLIKTVQSLVSANRDTGRSSTALMHLSSGQRGHGLLLCIETHNPSETTEKRHNTTLLIASLYAMEPHPPSHETLAACFGLTHRECEVAQMAVAGKATRDIGRQLSMSESSVRLHVQQALTKTGYQHMADMMQVLASLPSIPLPDNSEGARRAA
jgi:DNA-binding NarL/FixJ family response regulator